MAHGKKSVLILGGGIAGLAAARALAQREISVTVLEAQDRFGGRIHTLETGGSPLELGAEFIHGENPALLKAIQDAGLPIDLVPIKSELFQHGRFQETDIWDRASQLFQRVNPKEPDVPFETFLARQPDLDHRAKNSLRHFVEGFNAADSRRISSLSLRQAEQSASQMNGSKQYRIHDGYSALVDFLCGEVEKLGGQLVKNTRATQVAWQPGSVEVRVAHGYDRQTYHATAAIITLPLGILKANAVKFVPPLPEKLSAAQQMEFGNVVKIIFQFREQFWKLDGFIHALEEPIPTWWPDPRGNLLVGWTGGPSADALLRFSPPQLEEIGLQILGRIFTRKPDWLRAQLVASHYWNWAADPNIRGAYSYLPVNGIDLPKILAAPIAETLFFAGEATVADAQMGTVFGALESGLRAAGEVHRTI